MDMESREAELPPVEVTPPKTEKMDIKTGEPVKELGTEKNPEFTHATPASAASQAGQDDANRGSAGPQGGSPADNAATKSLVGQSPQIADDVDLIEKEWVEKAKEIVEKTKENPYLQNKAISEIKADYIKKRYNKDLAKSED